MFSRVLVFRAVFIVGYIVFFYVLLIKLYYLCIDKEINLVKVFSFFESLGNLGNRIFVKINK